MYHKGAIEGFPLQTYASALMFSPIGSLIRRLFEHEEPEGLRVRAMLSVGWSACLQTLEGHSDTVMSVAFSHDSTRLASASYDSTVKVWDASSGACLQTLKGHSSHVMSVAFSHDSTRLASASSDSTVKIWDTSNGACLQMFKSHSNVVSSADLFSILALPYSDNTSIEHYQLVRQEITISSDNIWVSDNTQKLLWLPTEYRPGKAAVSGRCVGVGTGSGKVWICRFE
jgi:WD40 repeat protein